MVVLRQSGLHSDKNWLYSGKSGCIRAKWLFSGKVVVFEQKWLYSGKVVVFGQKLLCMGKMGCIQVKWLYSGISGVSWGESCCFRAKVVVFWK